MAAAEQDNDDDTGFFCQAGPTLLAFPPAFPIRPFQPSRAIEFSHDAAPRFGKTSDIMVLPTGTRDERMSYIIGLVSGAICLFAFFWMWSCALVYFRLRGPKQYGWLSGSRIPLMPPPPVNDKNKVNDDDDDDDEEAGGEMVPNDATVEEIIQSSSASSAKEDSCRRSQQQADDSATSGTGSEEEEIKERNEDQRREGVLGKSSSMRNSRFDGDEENQAKKDIKQPQKRQSPDAQEGSPISKNTDDDDEEEKHMKKGSEPQEERSKELENTNSMTTEEWNHVYKRRIRQDRRMKCFVFAASICIIVSTIMMVSQGLPGLNSLVNSARTSLSIGISLTDTATVSAESAIELVTDTMNALSNFRRDFNGICPKVRDPLCDNLDNVESCRLQDIFGEDFIIERMFRYFVVDRISSVVRQVEQVKAFVDDLRRMMVRSDNLLNNIDWLFRLASFFEILLACLCMCVCVSLFLELPVRARRWFYRFFLAIFVFLVSFSFIFSIAFVITSTSMADACIDSPDDRIIFLLNRTLNSMPPFKRELADYVITRCGLPPKSMARDYMVSASNLLMDFELEFSNTMTTSRFEEVCGVFDSERWVTAVHSMGVKLCTASDTVADAQVLFQCSTWYPLYEAIVHHTLCGNVDALAWIAFTQFFVVCMAFIVITCRVTIYQGIEIDDGSNPPLILLETPSPNKKATVVKEEEEEDYIIFQDDDPKNHSSLFKSTSQVFGVKKEANGSIVFNSSDCNRSNTSLFLEESSKAIALKDEVASDSIILNKKQESTNTEVNVSIRLNADGSPRTSLLDKAKAPPAVNEDEHGSAVISSDGSTPDHEYEGEILASEEGPELVVGDEERATEEPEEENGEDPDDGKTEESIWDLLASLAFGGPTS